jgi:hypothetical protein
MRVRDEREDEVVRGYGNLERGGVRCGDVEHEGRRPREERTECGGRADPCSACVWCQSRRKRTRTTYLGVILRSGNSACRYVTFSR